MNWLLDLYYKFINTLNQERQDPWKRISTPVKAVNINANIQAPIISEDRYAEQLFYQKASLIEESLLQAKVQTKSINQVVKSTKNHPAEIQSAIKEIIKSCDSVVLNGIKLLEGEPIYLKYQHHEITIQLPPYSKQLLNEPGKKMRLPEMDQKIKELELAITESLENLEKFLAQIETSQQNYLSAGIDLKLFQNQADC